MIEQHFTLERMGEVLDRNPSTMRTHIGRGYVVGHGPRDGKGDKDKGKHERFSFFSLIEFAFAYEIAAQGVNHKMAFQYAAQFAHAGGTDITKMGEDVHRLPSFPFHYRHGDTYMGMMAGESAEISGEGNPDIAGLMRQLQRMTNSPERQGIIIIPATQIFAEVCTALRVEYRDVLAEVYGD